MLLHLLRKLRVRVSPWYLRARRRRPARPRVEPLEDRTVPSTVTWMNPAGGDWSTPGNWSGGAVPGAGDDVVINQPGAVTITHAAAVADAVHSVSAANPLVFSAGSLAVSTTLTDTSAVTLAGGTLSGADVTAGTVLAASAGLPSALQGVTLAGELDVTANGATVNVSGGLTLAGGAVNVGAGGALAFAGNQALGAASVGTVTLSGGPLQVPAGSSLTIDAGVTVHGAGSVGGGGAVTNDGTLASDAGGLLVVRGATNYSAGTLTGGTWQAVGDSTLELPGAAVTTNSASVLLDGAGAILASDAGTTNALANLAANTAAGALRLRDGALFATGAATFTNAGTVNVAAGSTFAVPGYSQTGGTTSLQGGTVGALLPPERTDLAFDGSQTFVSAPSGTSVRPTSQMTLEAWVNPSSLSNPQEGIAGTWDDLTGNNRTFLLWVESGHLAFYVSHTGMDFTRALSTTALQPGHWYHVAATFDGSNVRLYVNGTLEATTNTPGPIATNGHSFLIGRADAGGSAAQFFPGQIADVRLWNVALSQADVRSTMNTKLTGTEPGLLGYWTLDDGSGAVAVDHTGNDNGALSSPAPVWTPVAPGTVNGQGGTLSGFGTIAGSLTNSGELDLGSTVGTLNVEGGFTQTATGSLALKVGGTAAGTGYDQLNVAGAATLGGTLNVTLTGGFAPLAGQVFHVLPSASAGGAFTSANLPTADGVTAFTPQTTAGGFELVGATVPPTSTVSPLPAYSLPSFTVSWLGQDNAGGSGLAFFDVYVSDDGGPFTPFVLHTTATSATFSGVGGHTYGFYSVATDNIGNREATPAGAEATTTVPTQIATTTALSSSAASGSTYGQAVTFTVTVGASIGVFGVPTGSVQFAAGGVNLGGPVALTGGSASITTAALSAGAHPITAAYVSDTSHFADSTGGPLAQGVAPATLTVTAGNQTKVYGAAVPALTASYSGFVNGDGAAVLSGAPALNTAATASSPVAAYAITAAQGTLSAANYTFAFVNGTLTVTRASLTVTADNKTMTYGGPLPTLTGSLVGVVNGDNITASFSTAATSASGVGGYTITPALIDPNGKLANYSVTAVPGMLTVTAATLTVTADNKIMPFGGPVPVLTASYGGFVNGDTTAVLSGAPALSTPANSSSLPGTYPIFAVQGTLSAANYTFAFVNGTLTVIGPSSSATTTALVSSVNPSVFGQPVTFTAVVTPASGAGTPTGSVIFLDGAAPLATVALAGGQASFTTAALAHGKHDVTAVYLGDSVFAASTSPALAQKVKGGSTPSGGLLPAGTALLVGGPAGGSVINVSTPDGGATLDVCIVGGGRGHFRYRHSFPSAGLAGIVIYGGPGDNVIVVHPGVKLPAFVFGGGGHDYLRAGTGPSVLVGGGGHDVLVGGPGRDILIGGRGADVLRGRGGDDVLIGGTTDYDRNLAALTALLTEWDRADESYATRVSHLLGPAAGGSTGGANGAFYLNPGTVHDDGAADVLNGGAGQDWFFASAAGQDLLRHQRDGEVVTEVS